MIVKWFTWGREQSQNTIFPECGWGNGYWAVPPEHPFYHKAESSLSSLARDFPFYCHGGITFSAPVEETLNAPSDIPKGWWVLGFDTAHYKDNLSNWPRERVEEYTKEKAIELDNLMPLKAKILYSRKNQ